MKDHWPGTASGYPQELTLLSGKVFYSAANGSISSGSGIGTELWVSDGTANGTFVYADIHPGAASSSPAHLTVSGARLFFTATTGTSTGGTGEELYATDGISPPVLLRDINVGPDAAGGTRSSSPEHLTDVGAALFFVADDGSGTALWKSDGTGPGTVKVKTIGTGADPVFASLTAVGGTLFFAADDGIHGHELWKSDGTATGTVLVRDLYPGQRGSHPQSLWTHGGKLYFSATDGVSGTELWETDGTSSGTVLVADINPGSRPSDPGPAVLAGDVLYFVANDGQTGRELWAISLARPPDLEPPTLTCPASLSGSTTNPAGMNMSFPAPVATDNVDAAPSVTLNHASGMVFPVGTTTVTAMAKDLWGHTATCSFEVVISYLDDVPPVVTCPANQSIDSEEPHGVAVSYPPASAVDNVSASPTIRYSKASGEVFAIGTTQVTVTATDDAANSAACRFDVIVTLIDITPPAIQCPPDVLATTERSPDNRVSYGAATATDNIARAPVISYSKPSGSVFDPGETEVTATATDDFANMSSCTFKVTLLDDTAPRISCPADVAALTSTFADFNISYDPAIATDNVTASPTISYSKASGSRFEVGATTVTATVTDEAGNTGNCSFTVLLSDDVVPRVTCPGPVSVEAMVDTGAVVSYSATATDDVSASPAISYSKASGDQFPVGETTVSVTARDDAGNEASCSFIVSVARSSDVKPEPVTGAGCSCTSSNGSSAIVLLGLLALSLVTSRRPRGPRGEGSRRAWV